MLSVLHRAPECDLTTGYKVRFSLRVDADVLYAVVNEEVFRLPTENCVRGQRGASNDQPAQVHRHAVFDRVGRQER